MYIVIDKQDSKADLKLKRSNVTLASHIIIASYAGEIKKKDGDPDRDGQAAASQHKINEKTLPQNTRDRNHYPIATCGYIIGKNRNQEQVRRCGRQDEKPA